MSHTFRRNEVTDLIGQYKAGELTLDELAQNVPNPAMATYQADRRA